MKSLSSIRYPLSIDAQIALPFPSWGGWPWLRQGRVGLDESASKPTPNTLHRSPTRPAKRATLPGLNTRKGEGKRSLPA